MTFPVCDIFEQTVLNGRQCFRADAEKMPGQTILEGKESGMMFLVDVNTERSVEIKSSENNNKNFSKRRLYLGHDEAVHANLASVHIGTLALHIS